MNIVTKNALRLVKELSSIEREAIIQQFSVLKSPTPRQSTIALELAALAKSSDAWIQCDCMPELKPAFLFPRQTESGAVTLVRPRPPRQNPHHPSCVFFLENLPVSDTVAPQNKQQINDFCLLKPVFLHKDETSNDTDGQLHREAHELPRLTRILFDLIADAGLNRVHSHEHSFVNPYKSIYNAALKPLWPSSELKLSDVLTSSKEMKFYYMLINRLKTIKGFNDRRKQGYFVTLIDTFNDSSITVGTTAIEVKGAVHAPSRVPRGPYWAILLVGEAKPGSNYFQALRASVWPAYSEKFPFIVDSDPERNTLKELLSWRLYWKDRGLDFTIKKPLNWNTVVRPDFLIQDDETGETVIIETMGSDDKDYLDRKLKMHKDMQLIGPVIEHRPGDESLAFKKSITAALIN